MARYPNDARDYFGEVRKRHELRREARLPLLDVEAEDARLRQLDLNAAYANLFAHLMEPHNVKWDRPPTSWSESMGRIGPQRRAEKKMKPEVDRKWAEVLEIMLHTASTMTAPTTDAIHPALSLGPYHPTSWPRYVATKAPTMPRIAVKMKPDGSFGPGCIHFAITPTMAPMPR